MSHATARQDLISKRAFRSEGELIVGGLAVDQKLAAARVAGCYVSSGAVTLFAYDKQKAEITA